MFFKKLVCFFLLSSIYGQSSYALSIDDIDVNYEPHGYSGTASLDEQLELRFRIDKARSTGQVTGYKVVPAARLEGASQRLSYAGILAGCEKVPRLIIAEWSAYTDNSHTQQLAYADQLEWRKSFSQFAKEVRAKEVESEDIQEGVFAVAKVLTSQCPDLSKIDVEVQIPNTGDPEFRYLEAYSQNGWSIEDRRIESDCKGDTYAPPQGKQGWIPFGDRCPNALATDISTGKEYPKLFNWELYSTSHEVTYKLSSATKHNDVKKVSALIDYCSASEVSLELRLDPSEYEGSSGNGERLRQSIAASPDVNQPFLQYNAPPEDQPLFEFVLQKMVASASRCKWGLKETTPKIRIQLKDITRNNADIDEIAFVAFDLLPTKDNQGAFERRVRDRLKGHEKNGPFAGLEEGDYLNAIYAGDFQAVRWMEKQSAAPLFSRLRQYDDYFAFAELFSGQPEGRQIMRELLHEFSFINVVAAIYLQSYQSIYSECLGPNPASAVQVWEWDGYEIQDQYGNVQDRFEGRTTGLTFKAKREHQHILTKTVSVKPIALEFSSDIDAAKTIRSSVPRAMKQNACSSSEILQFEKNMIKYWEDWTARTKPITDRFR